MNESTQLFLFSFLHSHAQFSRRQAWTVFLWVAPEIPTPERWSHAPMCVFAWQIYCIGESVSQHLKERNAHFHPQSSPRRVCVNLFALLTFEPIQTRHLKKTVLLFFRIAVCAVNLSGLVFHQLSSSWLLRPGDCCQQGRDCEPAGHISHADSLSCGVRLCVSGRIFACCFMPVCVWLRISLSSRKPSSRIHKFSCIRVTVCACLCVLCCPDSSNDLVAFQTGCVIKAGLRARWPIMLWIWEAGPSVLCPSLPSSSTAIDV